MHIHARLCQEILFKLNTFQSLPLIPNCLPISAHLSTFQDTQHTLVNWNFNHISRYLIGQNLAFGWSFLGWNLNKKAYFSMLWTSMTMKIECRWRPDCRWRKKQIPILHASRSTKNLSPSCVSRWSQRSAYTIRWRHERSLGFNWSHCDPSILAWSS